MKIGPQSTVMPMVEGQVVWARALLAAYQLASYISVKDSRALLDALYAMPAPLQALDPFIKRQAP
jgi:hypothetical protein